MSNPIKKLHCNNCNTDVEVQWLGAVFKCPVCGEFVEDEALRVPHNVTIFGKARGTIPRFEKELDND